MRVGIYAFDEITMFHLAVPQMVFDEVARQGLAPWETFLFADRKGSVRTAEGYRIAGVLGLPAASEADVVVVPSWFADGRPLPAPSQRMLIDRKSTRLNSSHVAISYAVFCLKKKSTR